jgi:K+-transporting ATPase KdpF subunit
VTEAAMFEPIAGLLTALGLGAYLLVALLRPEKF